MKKILVFLILVLVFVYVVSFAETKDNLILTGSINMLFPADSNYSGIYGDSIMLPEFTANVKITGDWYVWAGYSFLNADGATPVFGSEAKSSQDFILLGAAYRLAIKGDFNALLKVGIGSISYKEEALDTTIKDSALGFYVDCGLFYDITEYFSVFASAGYMVGSDTVNDEDISLGGFKVGGGLAIHF
jgi:hypothetical protein